MYIFFIHTSHALVSSMQTIEISSGTSTSIILLTSPTFWVRDSSNTFIYNCAVWKVYAAKMRKLQPYNALNTLREIARPLCFNKKINDTCLFFGICIILWFFNQQDSTYDPFFHSCTCKNCPSTLQGKSHLCIPFLGIAQPQSQFRHSCVCERFIYFQDRSTYILAAERQTNPGNI